MNSQKIISQGAEAKIILNSIKEIIIKNRIKKNYRISEIDEKIRKRRTKAETKLLKKASKIINCPSPLDFKDKYKIKMPFIKGKKLSEELDNFSLKKQKSILNQIGKDIAKLHDNNIIHGDLTTSNMILVEEGLKIKNLKIFFLDFGLGFQNGKYEDKAVDLYLLKQALEAKHFKNWKILFIEFLKAYKSSENYEKTLQRLKAVEKRRRYKH